jgi:hypothetical protein
MHGSGNSPVRLLRQIPAGLSLLLTVGLAEQAPPQNPAEMATRDEPATFKARVNLVLVPVVVRDRQGRALGNLKREDFQLFKAEGRNRNDLTVVSGLFDRNGNDVIGNQERIELRLRDDTLENRLGSGIAVRTSYDVKPGSYMIRLVVRDDEGQLMAAANGAVEIP